MIENHENNNKKNKFSGGMYRGAKISIKVLDSIIISGIAAIFLVTVLAAIL